MSWFKRSRPPGHESFDAIIKTHAPALVQAAYQGLLQREADVAGLQHYVEQLRRDGALHATLDEFIGSKEFLGLVDARRRAHLNAISPALPRAARRIAIFGNCQGSNLARCIQVLTGAAPPVHVFVSAADIADPSRQLAALQQAIEHHDTVLLQPPFHAALQALGAVALEKVELVPSVSFAAFHPDFCGVRFKGSLEEIQGPMGRYQSSIAYYAWHVGMSVQQTLDLFCAPVYEALRFFDYWDASAQALLARGQSAALPLDTLLTSWRARGSFMHSPNHPRLFVIADLARGILQKLGVETLPLQAETLLWDQLADLPVCPVYPEIAERLGVAGSLRFKPDSQSLDGRAPVVSFDLETFVTQSFAAFKHHRARFELDCARPFTSRYQAVFGSPREWHRATPLGPPAAGLPQHPYAGLPAQQFWKTAIASQPMGAVDPVGRAGFGIDTTTRIATAGSCFAQHIARRLQARGFHHLLAEAPPAGLDAIAAASQQYGVYSARYGNVYTARQLRQLFDRAFGDFTPQEAPWPRADGRLADPFRPGIAPDGFADAAALMVARDTHLQAVRQLFETCEVFVFTLGLTEAWVARADGAVLPLAPGVVAGAMDATHHAFVNFSAAEVTADLDAFVTRLQGKNPSARVLFSVSPVPLAATYEDQSVLAASTYSKSVLRVAAEEICRRHAQCHYFPAYEIITGHFNRGAYFDADLRTVNAAGLDHVMRLFFAHYAPGAAAPVVDAELLAEAQRSDQLICDEARLAPT